MAVASPTVTDTCLAARAASRVLATMSTAAKDAALLRVADALEQRAPEILEANARDLEAGREAGLSAALMDRLALDPARISSIAGAVRAIAALPDPVGEVIDGHRLPNGLDVRKVRVPLGVIAVVYEARPNVTVDAAALCLKSGNAIVLRGSSSAAHSNAVLASIVAAEFPEGAVSLVSGARGSGGGRRPDHPAGWRGPEEGAERRRQGAGHLRRVGQLPRLRRRLGRPRRRRGDRRQRQGPAPRRLQRRRDAAGPRRRRGRVPAAGRRGPGRARRRAARRRARAGAGARRGGGDGGGLGR